MAATTTEKPTVFHLHLRATRPIPALDLEAGENLLLTYSIRPGGRLEMAYDDCELAAATVEELGELEETVRSGGLAIVKPPSADDLMHVLEHMAAQIPSRSKA
jgi:hypothetical protein